VPVRELTDTPDEGTLAITIVLDTERISVRRGMRGRRCRDDDNDMLSLEARNDRRESRGCHH